MPVPWIPNDFVSYCMNCERDFKWYRRRHHCRACGNLFCDACTPHREEVLPFYGKKKVRVCVLCHETRMKVEEIKKTK